MKTKKGKKSETEKNERNRHGNRREAEKNNQDKMCSRDKYLRQM